MNGQWVVLNYCRRKRQRPATFTKVRETTETSQEERKKKNGGEVFFLSGFGKVWNFILPSIFLSFLRLVCEFDKAPSFLALEYNEKKGKRSKRRENEVGDRVCEICEGNTLDRREHWGWWSSTPTLVTGWLVQGGEKGFPNLPVGEVRKEAKGRFWVRNKNKGIRDGGIWWAPERNKR